MIPETAAAREQGWTVIRDFFPPDVARELGNDLIGVEALDPRSAGMYVYRGQAPAGSGPAVVRIERFVERSRVLAATPVWRRIQEVAASYLDDEPSLFKDKINFRYPGSAGFGPHQDAAAGWTRYAARFVSIGLFPDGSDWESGGMEVSNRAHRNGMIANANGQLSADVFAEGTLERVEMQPTDLLLIDGLTPHRSNFNHGPGRRRHVFLTFAAPADEGMRNRYYEEKLATFPSSDGYYDFRLFSYGTDGGAT